ncbi:UDP-glucose 4-epimerase GalE [Candidatus Pelagibacter communis]|uniref:UDP-glucose 4-epimerase GalE n=1 Tax=Pelagibacter ubique TaxID=198252 RepID=UPI00094C6495|nr:UDP-glucose 4-epimerase GalE [Candidatus Pelagibacter ubique]
MLKNILITGGAGYIGSTVSHFLIDKGYSVTIIDNLITGHKHLVPKKADLIICDIDDEKRISNLLDKKKFELVMHFAGLIRVDESVKFPKKYYEYNYIKAKKFFEICFKKNLYNILLSSTAAVYGNKKKKVSEKSNVNPLNPYAKSKLKIENYLIKKSNKLAVKYIILRYFNVAGTEKRMRTGLISNFSTHLIKRACEVITNKRDKLTINGDDYNTKDGTPIRDYIHVSDLAEIHYLSLKYLVKKKKSRIFNCGYGYGYSVKDVITELNKISKKKIQTNIGPRRKSDSVYLVANSKKFIDLFLWQPKFNDLSKILNSSLEWEKKIKKMNKN